LVNLGVSLAGLFWLLICYFQAKREERELEKRFGQGYLDYKSRTPRFIPNFKEMILDGLKIKPKKKFKKRADLNFPRIGNPMMNREIVQTDLAPAALGPYSQACRKKGSKTLYVSAQIPLDPTSGDMLEDSVKVQTKRCMENLKAVLQASGLSFADVVRCTLYLIDMNDFPGVNEVYGQYFDPTPPARACFQVAALPKNAKVAIDAIAEGP
jgi:2-iminobutanoate/2-iminopropanoate deaminase